MSDAEIQPCTVCGMLINNRYLFEKNDDYSVVEKCKIYQCSSCNIIYLGQYSKIFDNDLYSYYSKYNGKTKDQIYDPLTKQSYLKVLELLDSYGGGKDILDVGCGNGSFVDAAMEQGYNIKGIELSQTAVNIAQEFGLPVQNMDFFSSEIEDASFDVLSMFEVIEHLPEPIQFLKRAEHVVKRGGLIYLTTPNFNALDRKVFGDKWSVFGREHLTYFTLPTLIDAINNHTGLEVVHAETRNISGELITYFSKFVRRSPKSAGRSNSGEISKHSPVPDARAMIASSPWLSLLKRGANFFLDATGLGSTIVLLLRRPL
jgi:2-polyprenyl-3-methyl-5-hydroxy-6-metoxy-1,4-benzoquinol methylase